MSQQGLRLSYGAGADMLAHRIAKLGSADMTLIHATDDLEALIGVTLYKASSGAAVSIQEDGIVPIQAHDAIAIGDKLTAAAAGRATAVGTPSGWATATAYAVGDRVLDHGITFRCIRAHTSGSGTEARPSTTTQTAWRMSLIHTVGVAVTAVAAQDELVMCQLRPGQRSVV